MKRPKMMRRLQALSAALTMVFALGNAAIAQDTLFAPRLYVNDRAITQYEVQQRMLFMQLLRAPGDLEKEAIKALVEDRLRMTAAEQAGIAVTPEGLQTGLEEFASRANLNAEQFTQALAQGGVEAHTFRDFVEAGLVWREVVRSRFAGRVKISDAEIDRAIAQAARGTEVRVLLSELVIPLPQGQQANVMGLARRIKETTSTEAGFAAAARQYSRAPTAGRGGALDWIPLSNLPPTIQPFVLALGPGQVSDPVAIPGAIAIFQLRGIEETQTATPASVSVEYAQFLVPNDASAPATLAQIKADVDTCNDLYGTAFGLPEDQLQRVTQTLAEVPQDIALALASLDANESAVMTRGNAQVFLMLCGRAPVTEEPLSRDTVREQLLNQRLTGYADGLLEDLRANAIIREP